MADWGKIWFYQNRNQARGPHSEPEVRQLQAAGRVTGRSLVRRAGDNEWGRFSACLQLCSGCICQCCRLGFLPGHLDRPDAFMRGFWAMRLRAVEREFPSQCPVYLSGAATVSSARILSMWEREQDVGEKLIRSAGSYAGRRVPRAAVEPLFNKVFSIITPKWYEERKSSKFKGLTPIPKEDCRYRIMFYEEIFKLPKPERTLLLRFTAQDP